MPEPILFYDIPTKYTHQKAWSPNTWKTRLCLNYKGLPYKTMWVEYPDIEAVSRSLGLSPTSTKPDGSPKYTLPAIYDPNTKTAVVDSAAIARYLDKTYPDTPRLIPYETDALHAAFEHVFIPTFLPDLIKIVAVPTTESLTPRSEAYFRAAHDITDPGPKREEHWNGFKKALQTFAQWLDADGTGNRLFFLGNKIGYADITHAAFLIWIRIVLGADSKEWKDITTWDGGRWARFMDAFAKYETVDEGDYVVDHD
ncbi:glutathione transferase FuA class [Trametes coccinea BRFM310]|uniref:Glutathione transferase FuA class n=1 Tax=Trametes coccinea (strain BRFM310) TaxID=1353009 RepID=A0A1Y2I7X4_TRAC3|nr:glutathione transferase FuA class [Trametes coccinea BRFM310]